MKVDLELYIGKNSETKFDIEFQKEDFYNLDVTLAYVIHAALIKFSKSSVPLTLFSDCPIDFTDGSYGNESGDHSEGRWEWIIDEMIFAFREIKAEDISDEKRVDNGLRLFGYYFENLWT